MTVADVRTELETTGQIGQSDRLLGEDGRWYKKDRQEARARAPPVAPGTGQAPMRTTGRPAGA